VQGKEGMTVVASDEGVASGAIKSARGRPRLLAAFTLILFSLTGGCAGWWSRKLPPPDPPMTIMVAQVRLEAPITKSTQVHTFEETPPAELEPIVRAQLIEEVELKAQRLLTEQVAAQPGFRVVPFGETRRLVGNLGVRRDRFSEAQLRALADESGADIIITGRIPDYGAVRWQYWVGGWAMTATAHLMTVGFASGWNPAVVGGFMALDLSTDLPFWWGGGLCLWLGLAPGARRSRGRADRTLWRTAVEYADGHGPDPRENACRVPFRRATAERGPAWGESGTRHQRHCGCSGPVASAEALWVRRGTRRHAA
jgi:hypothetical protein